MANDLNPGVGAENQESTLRVCYFGTYRADYARNRILIEGLRRNGVNVVECHETLWHGVEDREQTVAGGWKRPRFWVRVIRTYLRLLKRYLALGGEYDVLFVGYPGQFDVYLAWILGRLQRKPVVWDVLVSIYLIAMERGLDRDHQRTVNWLRRVEKMACHLPDLLFIDTAAHAEWFTHVHGVPTGRFVVIPIGTDVSHFQALPFPTGDGLFHVLYYGTFIPNHGVPVIVDAACLLTDDPEIQFELIGRGPERHPAEERTTQYGLQNVTFVDWLERAELQKHISDADLCLGALGTRPQTLLTVHNKVFECMAMARPVLTGRGPAVEASMVHGEHLYLCEPGDPWSLAQAIRYLKENQELRRRLALQGSQHVRQRFTVERTGRICQKALLDLVNSTRKPQ